MRSDRVRSVLYLPASNARAIEKARTLDCDVAVLDLEDAVAPEAKADARDAAVAALQILVWNPLAAVPGAEPSGEVGASWRRVIVC